MQKSRNASVSKYCPYGMIYIIMPNHQLLLLKCAGQRIANQTGYLEYQGEKKSRKMKMVELARINTRRRQIICIWKGTRLYRYIVLWWWKTFFRKIYYLDITQHLLKVVISKPLTPENTHFFLRELTEELFRLLRLFFSKSRNLGKSPKIE